MSSHVLPKAPQHPSLHILLILLHLSLVQPWFHAPAQHHCCCCQHLLLISLPYFFQQLPPTIAISCPPLGSPCTTVWQEFQKSQLWAVLTQNLSEGGPENREGRKHRHRRDLLTVLRDQHTAHGKIDSSSWRNVITRGEIRLWGESAHMCLNRQVSQSKTNRHGPTECWLRGICKAIIPALPFQVTRAPPGTQ